MPGKRAILTTSKTRAVIKFFFPARQGAEEIHAILTETLACFLRGRAKNLSAPLYNTDELVTAVNIPLSIMN